MDILQSLQDRAKTYPYRPSHALVLPANFDKPISLVRRIESPFEQNATVINRAVLQDMDALTLFLNHPN